MSNYWENRELKERLRLLDASIKDTEGILAREFRKIQIELTKDIERLFYKIMDEDKPLASHLYQYQDYYELLNEINNRLNKLGIKESEVLENKFTNLYKYTYSVVGDKLPATVPNNDRVYEVINAVWVNDGGNWSDRVWDDKKKLAAKLKELLSDSITRGISNDKLTEEIMNTFNQSYHRSSTLVRTEMSHIWNESALDKYKDAGIDKVMFITGKDEKTCEECKSYNEQVYNIELAPTIPVHCNCRCTYLAVIE